MGFFFLLIFVLFLYFIWAEDGNGKKNTEVVVIKEKKKVGGEGSLPAEGGVSSSAPVLPCMDRLREELSCAVIGLSSLFSF